MIAQYARHLRWHHKTFVRNPAAAFFVIAFPLFFLPVFNSQLESLFSSAIASTFGTGVRPSSYFLSSVIVFSVVTTMFSNTAINVTAGREDGVYKRIASTPASPAGYVAMKVIHAGIVSLCVTLAVVVLSAIVYDSTLPAAGMVGLVLAVLVGSTTFGVLGLALTTVIPTAEAALPMVNAIILPLLFSSGVFIPESLTLSLLTTVMSVLPIAALADAVALPLHGADGAAVDFRALGLLLVWGLVGLGLFARTARWTPAP